MKGIYLFVYFLVVLGSRVTSQYSGDGDSEDYADESTPPGELSKFNVTEGHKIVLPCVLKETSNSILKWERVVNGTTEDVTVEDEVRLKYFDIEYKFRKYNLVMSKATYKDAGKYICYEIRRSTKTPLFSHLVNVFRKTQIDGISPSDDPIYVPHNGSLTLTCKTSGFPVPTVTWSREGGKLPNGEEEHQGATIRMFNAWYKYSGVYKCQAVNSRGETDFQTVKVIVKSPPSVDVKSSKVYATPGQKSKLVCIVDSYMTPTVTWFKNGSEVIKGQNNDSYLITSKISYHYSLKFPTTSSSDFGEYACRVENNGGMVTRQLELADKSYFDKANESLVALTKSEVYSVGPGQNLTLPCEAERISGKNLMWRRQIEGSSRPEFISHNNIVFYNNLDAVERSAKYNLRISGIKLEDAGNYTCFQWKNKDHGIELVTHTVQVKPFRSPTIDKITPEDKHLYLGLNESVTLTCNASGFPEPLVTWEREGGKLPGGQEVQNSSTLELDYFTDDQAGTYKCKAQNDQGEPAVQTVQISYKVHSESTEKPDENQEAEPEEAQQEKAQPEELQPIESGEGEKANQTVAAP